MMDEAIAARIDRCGFNPPTHLFFNKASRVFRIDRCEFWCQASPSQGAACALRWIALPVTFLAPGRSLYYPARTLCTLSISLSGVKGFWRKQTELSSTPVSLMMRSV